MYNCLNWICANFDWMAPALTLIASFWAMTRKDKYDQGVGVFFEVLFSNLAVIALYQKGYKNLYDPQVSFFLFVLCLFAASYVHDDRKPWTTPLACIYVCSGVYFILLSAEHYLTRLDVLLQSRSIVMSAVNVALAILIILGNKVEKIGNFRLRGIFSFSVFGHFSNRNKNHIGGH